MESIIQKLKAKSNLSGPEIESVMKEIMSGNADKNFMADFLLLLRAKGPTVEEITGAARIMRQFVVPVTTKHQNVLDTCGTGGDKRQTFNISTISALVVAGAGGIVAKHGNRSISSKCGSADLLEALGVNLNVEQEHMQECLDTVGIAFLFAQKLHPAMKNVAPVRKQLGVETIFNILGPLTNPANATHQIMGVYNRDLVQPMAEVLRNLGLKRAMVVHGSDGLDEITTTGKSFISEFDGREIVSCDFSPEELGLPLAASKDLEGGDLNTNVQIALEILDGQGGPKRDIVVLNAGYALFVAQIAEDLSEGMQMAEESIDEGKAFDKLQELKEFTHRGA